MRAYVIAGRMQPSGTLCYRTRAGCWSSVDTGALRYRFRLPALARLALLHRSCRKLTGRNALAWVHRLPPDERGYILAGWAVPWQVSTYWRESGAWKGCWSFYGSSAHVFPTRRAAALRAWMIRASCLIRHRRWARVRICRPAPWR